MKGLNSRKSLGPDGLLAEFYQTFWDHCRVDLTSVLSAVYSEGLLAPSMTESIITLVYKGKGDECSLNNWRPINLLEADYKLLAKALMYRLQETTPQVVGSDQACGVPEQSTVDNLVLIRDIMAHSVER